MNLWRFPDPEHVLLTDEGELESFKEVKEDTHDLERPLLGSGFWVLNAQTLTASRIMLVHSKFAMSKATMLP